MKELKYEYSICVIEFFYGKAPVLEVDGKQLGQSTTILRFLAEKFALAGKDEWEKAKADEIINFQKDATRNWPRTFMSKKDYAKAIWRQARIKESGSDYMLPSGLSMVGNFLYTFTKLDPDTIKAYPELIKYVERVHALPQLQKYLQQRPQDR
uniref:glutathione transferase n=1 Tax=Globodera rostochiensis TaxID=31243 RepID=A0A914HLP1_GLORO